MVSGTIPLCQQDLKLERVIYGHALSWLTGYGEQVNFTLYDSIRHSLTSMAIVGDRNCRYCAGFLSIEKDTGEKQISEGGIHEPS